MNKEIFEKLLQEYQELGERINNCRMFIMDEANFNSLDPINKDLLIAQLKSMETYFSILSIRIGVNGTPETLPKEVLDAISTEDSEDAYEPEENCDKYDPDTIISE